MAFYNEVSVVKKQDYPVIPNTFSVNRESEKEKNEVEVNSEIRNRHSESDDPFNKMK